MHYLNEDKCDDSKSKASKLSSRKNKNCSTSSSRSGKALSAAGSSGIRIQMKECGECHATKDQHLLALCDSCHLHYHLYCLDPPLRRMPKKTRFGGWQCSNCTETELNSDNGDDEDVKPSIDAIGQIGTPAGSDHDSNSNTISGSSLRSTVGRRLREHPKASQKYTSDKEESKNSPSSKEKPIVKSSANKSSTQSRKKSRKPRPKQRPNENSGLVSNAQITGPSVFANLDDSQVIKTESVSPITNRKRKLSQTEGANEDLVDHVKQEDLVEPVRVSETDRRLSGASSNELTLPKRSPLSVECNQCKEEVQVKLSVR